MIVCSLTYFRALPEVRAQFESECVAPVVPNENNRVVLIENEVIHLCLLGLYNCG